MRVPVNHQLGNNIDFIVDLTLGATAEISGRATVAVAAVAPLTGGSDKPFDWELNVQVNYRFGPTARRSNAPR